VNMGDYGKLYDYVTYNTPLNSMWAADVDCSKVVNMGDYGKLYDYVTYNTPLNCCEGCEV